jgi:hypothetical protein
VVRRIVTTKYYTKTLIANKFTKRALSLIVTFLHVSTLLGHLQGEIFCYRYTKVALHSWGRMYCWLCTALFLEAWTLCGPGLHCEPGPQIVHASSTQSTAHCHSTIKCNLSVTITKSYPWRWPSRVETCRSVLQLMIKLSLWFVGD